jgi:hypothetical protein
LVLWNLAAGLVAGLFLYFLALRLTGHAWISAGVSVAYLSSHAVLNFAQTGTAYMTGSACLMAALYFLHAAILDGFSWRKAIGAGLGMGIAASIWFPFVLPVPGLLCFLLLWPHPGREIPWKPRAWFAVRCCSVAALCGLLVYAGVMAGREIGSIEEARAWMRASRYGIQPTNGLARLVFSIPRSFFLLGDVNTVLKRVLLGGEAVGVMGLLEATWRLIATYLFFAAVLWGLRGSAAGKKLLWCLAITAVPLFIFAAFLFDPSPPERYMGLFPLLFAGLAWILARPGSGLAVRGAVVAFCALMLASNLAGMFRYRPNPPSLEAAITRLEAVNRQATANDQIFVPSFSDETLKFIDEQPFHPASRLRLNLMVGLPIGNVNALRWRAYVADLVLPVWKQGGRVWISQRFLLERPSPEWWVEGDDARMSWPEITAFFRSFELGPAAGDDGFQELLNSTRNQELLREEQRKAP